MDYLGRKDKLMSRQALGLSSMMLVLVTLILAWKANTHASPLPTAIHDWTTAVPLPEVLASRNAVVNRNRIYVVGGKNATEQPSAQVYTAQVQADGSLTAWASTTPLPVPVYLHAVAATASDLYLIGGWDGTRTRSDVWRAPFVNNGLGAWEKISDYPMALDLHEATIVNQRLYVLGGRDGTVPLSKVYYADIQTTGLGAWTPALDLPAKLYRLAVTSTAEFIYATGGYDGRAAQSTVYYTKVNSDGSLVGWQPTTPLPDLRYYHETVVHNGTLVVLAGKDDTTEYNSVYGALINADGSLGAWNAQPALPESLYRFAAVTVMQANSEFIYLFGGLHQQDYRQQVYHSTVPSPPTPTSTPTPPPTMTLQLQNEPQHWVAPGEVITYALIYQNQGVKDATDVIITGTIPTNTELIPDSVAVESGSPFTITSSSGNDDTIFWHADQLDATAAGVVSYRVRRLLAPKSSPQRALAIMLAGPEVAHAGAPIRYQMTITNLMPITLTNVMVFDRLPEAARYVSGANQSPVNNLVQ